MYELDDFDRTDPICLGILILGVVLILILGAFTLLVGIATSQGRIIGEQTVEQSESKDILTEPEESFNHIVIETYSGGKTYSIDNDGNTTVIYQNE